MRMGKMTILLIGAATGMALIVTALWAWQHGDQWPVVLEAARPEVVAWAVRSAAVATAALAQVILLVFVADRLYGRDLLGRLLRWTAAAITAAALVSTIVLALAGR